MDFTVSVSNMRMPVQMIVNSAATAGKTSAKVATTVIIDTASPATLTELSKCSVAIYAPIAEPKYIPALEIAVAPPIVISSSVMMTNSGKVYSTHCS